MDFVFKMIRLALDGRAWQETDPRVDLPFGRTLDDLVFNSIEKIKKTNIQACICFTNKQTYKDYTPLFVVVNILCGDVAHHCQLMTIISTPEIHNIKRNR